MSADESLINGERISTSNQKQTGLQKYISRRLLMKSSATVLCATAASGFAPGAQAAVKKESTNAPVSDNEPSIVASDETAIVETVSGKVRGYIRDGIYTYKGIPYGATTEGPARFMPPQKAKPWTGVRSSMQYGRVSPQGARDGWDHDEEAWLFSWDDGIPGEDCLRVNLWTPGVNDHKKRPVMVWLHGGGYYAGSGQELRSYDGERLSRRGDVVVVSLNHRLGPLGYLNLANYGDRYASSSNVGMLDIVAALEWVRDNISNFGGDPGNVTIFGQSGGGGKVGTLMAMPDAKGLFHRAIIQSGSILRAGSMEKTEQLAASVLSELNLSASQVDELQKLPVQKLIDAGAAALKKMQPPGMFDWRKIADWLGWGPVVDGKVLPQHPFDPGAPKMSADVPLLVGTTLNEFFSAIGHPEAEAMTQADLKKGVGNLYGEKAASIIEIFTAAHPHEKPFDIFSRIMAAPIRQSAVTQAGLKAALGAAAAYLYWFAWKTPVLDGRPRAFHCSELSFCFDNTDRCENMTGGGAGPRALAANISDAWINFARKGDPNHPGIPHWAAFTAENCPTMIFDKQCEARNNPDTKERQAVTAA
ncbi:MAG TPA: carboxylesterase family protein [Terriglobales bacterium]|jgi:para-nitrobenzyl esterase